MSTELSIEILKRFSPLESLKRQNLVALQKKTTISQLDAGRVLFKVGDASKRTIFVVSGTVELRDESGEVVTIHGGTPESRGALSPGVPRRHTAKARDDIEFISIDSDLLDVMLTWDQTGTYEVSELNSDSRGSEVDWMTTLLQTRAFTRIPPANIQAIFMRMQQVKYSAGDVVIKQGEDGDYFYAITSGQCVVMRETPLNKDGIRLAELGPGDTFGEEALISSATRNATVTMSADGSVMRLAKEDFHSLLNEPMLDWVDLSEARELVEKGAQWLDVRLPSEFDNVHEDEAINIPLYFIRLKLNTLDEGQTYIVCCDTGSRSSAGAFILSEKGFDVRVLQGGLNAATETATEAG
jgi:CRP-like cAMP-binding protein